MPAKALMIQGTGSHVGKSLLAAALCRIFKQDGHRVLPFKAQNMSNNADVTRDGGEIGRAQAEQARACGVEPSVLMNPILLKPTTDIGAQVIVLGKAVGTMRAEQYEAFKSRLRTTVTQALNALMENADVLVMEGAGSPAEVNLKRGDLANMWAAKQAHARVFLVGDIDRGGVFAQLVGTMELLSADERKRVCGFIINKFRGDLRLLQPGIRWLEKRTALPVVGVIPYLHDVQLAEEDAINDERLAERHNGHRPKLRIEVVRLPRISNFTDFEPLRRQPDVQVRFIDRPSPTAPDCLILPGTKSTMADLMWMRTRGLDVYVHRCAQEGREVIGVCGGFQMLGQAIADPQRLEASVSRATGLGLLPVTTTFYRKKITRQVRATHVESGLPVLGYEIHMGRMRFQSPLQPVLRIAPGGRKRQPAHDGAHTPDGRMWGTHVHGLFDAPAFCQWWLTRLRRRRGLAEQPIQSHGIGDDPYDRLAADVRPHLDMERLYAILKRP